MAAIEIFQRRPLLLQRLVEREAGRWARVVQQQQVDLSQPERLVLTLYS